MTAENYQICLNSGEVVELSHKLFEKFPKDSLLYNLLKDDQMMATRNEHGQYLLTLDHPELFQTVMNYFETRTITNCDIYHSAKQFFNFNVADAMQALAQALNYLGLPILGDLKGFQEESETNCLAEIAETIIREAEKQIYDFSIEFCNRMTKQNNLFLKSIFDVSWAKHRNETQLEMNLDWTLLIRKDDIFCRFQPFNDELPTMSVKQKTLAEIVKPYNIRRTPLYLLANQDKEILYEIIRRIHVPAAISMFCKNSKTSVESSSTKISGSGISPDAHILSVALKLKL